MRIVLFCTLIFSITSGAGEIRDLEREAQLVCAPSPDYGLCVLEYIVDTCQKEKLQLPLCKELEDAIK